MPVTVPDRFHNVTLAGNTAGALAEVISGTLTLAGGNNITLSQAGNAVTISGAAAGGAQTAISGLANSETTYTSGSVTLSALGAITIRSTTGQHFQFSVNAQTAESQSIGMSNLGNTSGTTGMASGAQVQYVLAGGNNVTLSQSLNGASGTVTISAFNQTVESQSIGMSNVGNTSGTTGMASGGQVRFVFAGGNNITLSQSLNGASGTITISAANETQTVPPIATTVQSVATANSVGTVTRFAPEDHRHEGVYAVGVSTGGNTSGNTTVEPGRLVLAGGNLINLSQATAAAALKTVTVDNLLSSATTASSVTSANVVGAMASRFALEAHQHAGVGPAGVSTGGNTSGDTTVMHGRIVFAGGNNITLSVSSSNNNNQTITISAPNLGAGAGFTAGMSNLGNTAGTTGVADSRLVIVGSDGIKLSQSLDAANHSGTLSIINSWSTATTVSGVTSANLVGNNNGRFALEDHQHAGVFSMGVSTGGNTSGDTTVEDGQFVLAGGNGITLSQATGANDLNTITISAGVGTLDYWNNFQFITWGTSQVGQSTVFMTPMPLAAALQFDRALHYVTVSQSTSSNSSYSIAVEFHCGVYTKNASTLSLLKSGSGNNAWSMTSNNTTANQAGVRMITAAIQTTLTPGNYWLAFLSVTKTSAANWASISNQIIQAGNTVFSGPIAVASNSSYQPVLGAGIFSAQTAALPNSIAFSQIYGASAAHFRSQPLLALANGTMP